jgi:hypothetical protein
MSNVSPLSPKPVICPTGKSIGLALDRLSSPSRKNILIFRNRKSVYIHGYPASQEGRFAVVTDVGCGMRWTLSAPLTNGAIADGEVVWTVIWYQVKDIEGNKTL